MANTERSERAKRIPLSQPGLGRELAHRWGLYLALGILLVIIGLFSLSAIVVATLATVVIFAVVVLVAAITQLVLALSARSWRGFSLHLLVGVLGGVVGVLLITNPGFGAGVLTLLVAIWLLATGIGQIVHALAERFPSWGWSVFGGAVSTLLGVILIAQFPLSSLWFLGFFLGIHLVVQGMLWVALAMTVHSLDSAGRVPA